MEAKQLELFDLESTEERNNYAAFSLSEAKGWAFIDTFDSLKHRTRHSLVIRLLDENSFFYYNGKELNYINTDSRIRGINLNLYFKISQIIKDKGFLFNKKTCQIKSLR